MIATVTDSGSQMPPAMAERYGVTVVPLIVIVDGLPHREGVDLPSTEFYDAIRRGASVSTSAPSPGDFSQAYESAASAGVAAVLSIHTGSNLSGTVNAARLAARSSPIPVVLVDTGTVSFPVACCVWEAAEALAAGASLEEAAAAARRTANTVGNVFIVGLPELARRGGRFSATAELGETVPILALEAGEMRVVANATTAGEAVEAMAAYVERWATDRRVRIGVGDAEASDLADALEQRIAKQAVVSELVRYEVGPSVGAHTGPGTVGAVFYARAVRDA